MQSPVFHFLELKARNMFGICSLHHRAGNVSNAVTGPQIQDYLRLTLTSGSVTLIAKPDDGQCGMVQGEAPTGALYMAAAGNAQYREWAGNVALALKICEDLNLPVNLQVLDKWEALFIQEGFSCNSVTALTLGGCVPTPQRVCELEMVNWSKVAGVVGKMKNLVHLDLRHAQLCSKRAATLAKELDGCNTLHHLELSFNNIQDEGMQALTWALRNCSKLQHLGLANNGISNEGASVLSHVIGSCHSLKHLNLEWNTILAQGAEVLSNKIGQLKDLEYLNLGGCSIEDDGSAMLAPAISCCTKLKELHLQHNNIRSHGAWWLSEARQFILSQAHQLRNTRSSIHVSDTVVPHILSVAASEERGSFREAEHHQSQRQPADE
mmetsp:Transcript_31200/g.48858  ORF Transcript_31200/g.48858 Transcript_31200/m.48858 type:complete len:380 (+) Transcript_31200:114-1253(+)